MISIELERVSVPKAADVLAAMLREKILQGGIEVGTDLPNERELGAQAGLSRASVREALRILEGEGLIVTRVGRNGGSAVVRPSSETIERSVGIFIRGQGIRRLHGGRFCWRNCSLLQLPTHRMRIARVIPLSYFRYPQKPLLFEWLAL